MRRTVWQVLLLSLALVAPAGAAPGTINVQEFGAKGNGHTDDTEAIRTAMKAAAITRSQPSPLGVYYQTGPTLVFPSGEYLVSDAIVIEALEVRGEGRAVLRARPTRRKTFSQPLRLAAGGAQSHLPRRQKSVGPAQPER